MSKEEELVHQLKEAPSQDIKKAREFLKSIGTGVTLSVFVLLLAALLLVSLIVLLNPVPYKYMYFLFSVLPFGFLSFFIMSVRSRRMFRAALHLIIYTIVVVLWAVILIDKVPAEKVVYDGEVVLREEMKTLFVPIVIYFLTIPLLIAKIFFKIGEK
ncbi:MAG: hypothetical protein FJ088_05635 [Deltaproteobacteria bacterium]|nr:hypothetical protein [Deltaproteobacteria bacterium]